MAPRRHTGLTTQERERLEQACARNQPADIHYHEGSELRTARTRLLAIAGDELYIDRPQCIGQNVVLAKDMPLTLYLLIASELYAFSSRVVRPVVTLDLNRRRQVTGVALRMPAELRKQQRREQFRLSLAKADVAANLHKTSADAIDVVPRDAPRFTGRIVNISLGGVAVLYDVGRTPPLAPGEVLFVEFTLPEAKSPLVFPVEVRHFRSVRDDESRICGLRFLDTAAPAVREQVQQLNKFIAEEQRRQLRHIRRGGAVH
ncbi:MAG: PilZ domain-containing protein [Planctomycetota bacterium]